MNNIGLEIIFWIILLIYLGVKLTQTKKVTDKNIKLKID